MNWREPAFAARVDQALNSCVSEPLPGTRYLHAVGETKRQTASNGCRIFGPEHGPLEQRHVELAGKKLAG